MSTMPITLQLPTILQRQLQHLASFEGVSLDKYIVTALNERVNQTAQLYPLSEAEIAIEQEKMDRFVASLGRPATDEEFDAYMDSLPPADPDPNYPPELHAKYMSKIVEAKAQKQKA